jgi:hypothetical protein
LLAISEVDDREIFKVCLEYWRFFSELMYTEASQPLSMVLEPKRRSLYTNKTDIMNPLRRVLISKMVKPEEVLVVENENGELGYTERFPPFASFLTPPSSFSTSSSRVYARPHRHAFDVPDNAGNVGVPNAPRFRQHQVNHGRHAFCRGAVPQLDLAKVAISLSAICFW